MTPTLSALTPHQRFDLLPQLVGQRGPNWAAPLASTFLNASQGSMGNEARVELGLESLLSALQWLDQCFVERLGYRGHVYLLGDSSLQNVAAAVRESRPTVATLEQRLEMLAVAGLIYRFNVAQKFCLPNALQMQLRLNGWGRSLVRQLPDHAGQVARLDDEWGPEITTFENDYQELLGLCNSQERPLQSARIAELHDIVPIPVVT